MKFRVSKKNYHQYLLQDYNFWQDSNANEIDILMKTEFGFNVFEIKATQALSSDLFKQLDRFEVMVSPIKVNKH